MGKGLIARIWGSPVGNDLDIVLSKQAPDLFMHIGFGVGGIGDNKNEDSWASPPN